MANDSVSSTGELPYIAGVDDFLDGVRPGPALAVMHAGQLVVADLAAGDPIPGDENRNIKVRRYNGSSWDDLNFPTTTSFAFGLPSGPGVFNPLPREGSARMASDGETLWLALVVDEQVNYNAYLYPSRATTAYWNAGGLYVFAYNGGWALIYYRAPATLNTPSVGPITFSPGFISFDLASEDGAGCCWCCSIEAGARGTGGGDPFTSSLAISTQLGPGGPIAETFGLAYGHGSPLYTGGYYGPDRVDDGTVSMSSGLTLGRVAALALDTGVPVYVSTVFEAGGAIYPDSGLYAPPSSLVRADTFEQLQAIPNYYFDAGAVTHAGRLFVGMETADATVTSQYYPEEVFAGAFHNRVEMITVPLDGSAPFTPLLDMLSEDVSLAKNPLAAFGPEDFSGFFASVAAVTGSHRVWILLNIDRGFDDALALFVLNDECPLVLPQHGRYAWDYAKTGAGAQALIVPAVDTHALLSSAQPVYDPASNRIYAVGWANAGDGSTYLRCWYFQLCPGCIPCGPQGLHLWQRI